MSSPKPIAVLADVHGNLEALEVVLMDIAAKGITDIRCLGDLVGYGPDAYPCMRLAMEHFSLCLMGNHDCAMFRETATHSGASVEVRQWTKSQIEPKWYTPWKLSAWNYLRERPKIHTEGPVTYVHGSPRDYLFEYVIAKDVEKGRDGDDKLMRIFDEFEELCFVGHSHKAGLFIPDPDAPAIKRVTLPGHPEFSEEEEIIQYQYVNPRNLGRFSYTTGKEKAIVNVGSVGQPRDSDPRACYVIYDGRTVTFRWVPYDVGATQRKVLASKLPDRTKEYLAKCLEGGAD